jgi:hypothetical protein
MAIAIGLVAMAIAAAPASAATTRAEWVAQVDPICQNGMAQEAAAAQPLIKASKRAKKQHNRKAERKIARALRNFFTQYAAIEAAVNAQIATVPPAIEDVSLIQVWLRARAELVDLERRLFTSKPQAGRGVKGFTRFLTDFFTLGARQLEIADLVRDFGFQYCNAPPPKTAIVTLTP